MPGALQRKERLARPHTVECRALPGCQPTLAVQKYLKLSIPDLSALTLGVRGAHQRWATRCPGMNRVAM